MSYVSKRGEIGAGRANGGLLATTLRDNGCTYRQSSLSFYLLLSFKIFYYLLLSFYLFKSFIIFYYLLLSFLYFYLFLSFYYLLTFIVFHHLSSLLSFIIFYYLLLYLYYLVILFYLFLFIVIIFFIFYYDSIKFNNKNQFTFKLTPKDPMSNAQIDICK